jgi:hypothetical protein
VPYHFECPRPAGNATRQDFAQEIAHAVERFENGQLRSVVILGSWFDDDTTISSHVENEEDRRNLIYTAERIANLLRSSGFTHNRPLKEPE